MKRKNIIFALMLIMSGIFAIQSCTKEDNTTFTTKYAFAQPVFTSPVVYTDSHDNTIARITGTTATLTWSALNLGNLPIKWDVYFGTTPNPPKIQTAYNKQTLVVNVVDSTEYFWKVVTTDPQGVLTTSETKSFYAINGTNAYMNMDLSCQTDVKSVIGMDLAPDVVADLRLLIVKKSDMSVVSTIDVGYTSESYDGFKKLPDGDYLIGVDLLATKNFGDYNKPIKLSLNLKFDQLGVIDQALDFPNVMTNANPCSLYRTYLANVNKVGAKYTLTSAVSYMTPPIVTWKGTDDAYPSQVTTTSSCTTKTMKGLSFGWMLDYWGETITSGGTLTYTISGNTITIPLQKYCKTTYKTVHQAEYSIQGSGTIDNTGAYPIYTIKYDLLQGGSTIFTVPNGFTVGFLLEAKITTNPAGLPVKKASGIKFVRN